MNTRDVIGQSPLPRARAARSYGDGYVELRDKPDPLCLSIPGFRTVGEPRLPGGPGFGSRTPLPTESYRPAGTGRLFAHIPGTPYLATIILSLRDKSDGPLRDKAARSLVAPGGITFLMPPMSFMRGSLCRLGRWTRGQRSSGRGGAR
jgi:hypothetical protein